MDGQKRASVMTRTEADGENGTWGLKSNVVWQKVMVIVIVIVKRHDSDDWSVNESIHGLVPGNCVDSVPEPDRLATSMRRTLSSLRNEPTFVYAIRMMRPE